MNYYKIADVTFGVQCIYGYTPRLLSGYAYNESGELDFIAVITKEDIAAEKAIAPEFSEPYLESLSVFRKLCDYCLTHADGIVFHSSAVMVDGKAYLFTAPSGTGKSTHAGLWRELLGERAVMINDDKPIIRYTDGKFYVYGTPYNGKHKLDTNTRAEIKAVCKIEQAKENSIRPAGKSEMLITMLNQTVRPSDEKKMDMLLSFIERLLNGVDLYVLGCNISLEAAKLSYETMSKGGNSR